MAGFAAFRPHPPDGRTAIPAARRYAPAVSRRICAALSMRRNDHPQPSQRDDLLFLFFAQDIAHVTERNLSASSMS